MRRLAISLALAGLLAFVGSAAAQTTTTAATTTTTTVTTTTVTTTTTTTTTTSTTTTTILCDSGGIVPGKPCHKATACATLSGQSFTGLCIGGAGSASTVTYTRCGNANPICAALGTASNGTAGCNGDAVCPSGYVCVSDAGASGCGTGFSQCIKSCSDATTTTTTTSTTTTT